MSVKKLVDIVTTGSMLMLLMKLPTLSPICQRQCFKKQESQIENYESDMIASSLSPTTSPEQEWSGYQQEVCCSVWSNFQFDQIWSQVQARHPPKSNDIRVASIKVAAEDWENNSIVDSYVDALVLGKNILFSS